MGTTAIISVANDSTQGNSYSRIPAISGNGRYVAFESGATNLVPNDTNGTGDIFVHDRLLGTTTRVSVASGGIQGNGQSYAPDISDDGRYVTFISDATNLGSDYIGLNVNVFIHDRQTNLTSQVNLADDTGAEDFTSSRPNISSDGRYVTFSNLTESPSADTYVYDRQNDIVEFLDISSGSPDDSSSKGPVISGNGRYVAFDSEKSNLVPNDTNGKRDIFVYDRQQSTTTRVSIGLNGSQSDGNSYSPSISNDGRYVVFESDATNIGSQSSNLFIHDRQTGITSDVIMPDDPPLPGIPYFSNAYNPVISGDGRYVVFLYNSSRIVSGLYLYDRQIGQTQEILSDCYIYPCNNTINASDVLIDVLANPSISNDGLYIAFDSDCTHLVPGDTNNTNDVFVYDLLGLNINGTRGNDTLNGGNNSDVINGLGGHDLLNGLAGNDTLNGDTGNDTLDGGVGSDRLVGGTGNDTYIVDSVGDVVVEAVNAGIDIVNASITSTLADNVEKLTLTGNSLINGTGNNLNNVITGNSNNNTLNGLGGNDTLDGGVGSDRLVGGTGNDTYIVDNVGDVVVEAVNAGIDKVNASVTATLADNVENLTLTGNSSINGTGNNLNNKIIGNAANNLLDGLGGDDVLNGGEGNDTFKGGLGNNFVIGGTGNDTYIVHTLGDIVVENVDEGIDEINASITITLANNVENLTLTGNSIINGTGNTLNNIITGNSSNNKLNGLTGNDTLNGNAGNDTLDGGVGSDSLVGGTGNDTYILDSAGDVVVESANAGIDKVSASITTTLSSNVENLTLTGNSLINGTGNTLNNKITGNSGNNNLNGQEGNDTLDGGVGSDSLVGGTGDDTYMLDNLGDVVTENLNAGIDKVITRVTATLANNVENLNLSGYNSTDGTGNTLNNVITGNVANNILNGATGNDTLIGGVGDDILVGGAGTDSLNGDFGKDKFRFNSPTEGIDSLQDFNVIDDIIEVSSTAFNIPLAILNPTQFLIGTEATNSSHRFIYNKDTGGFFFDRDGSGSIASVQIANLPALLNLTANNIAGI